MNGYTDVTSNLENSRNCLRRIARHDDQEFSNQSILNAMEKFVKTVNAMDETILVPCRLMDRKVGDSTDNVPVSPKYQHHSKKKSSAREILNTSDLFNLYNMLNIVKVDLLWGRNDADDNQDDMDAESLYKLKSSTQSTTTSSTTNLNSLNNNNNNNNNSSSNNTNTNSSTEPQLLNVNNTNTTSDNSIKGHIRRPSTVSMASSNSTSTLSDSESEISNENDSGIESEGNPDLDKSTEMAKQFRTHLLGLYKSLEQMTEAANYLTARYQSDVGPV